MISGINSIIDEISNSNFKSKNSMKKIFIKINKIKGISGIFIINKKKRIIEKIVFYKK